MWTARAAAIVVPVDVLQLPPAVSSGCWARASASRTKRSSEPGTASCPRVKQRELPLLGIQTHQRAHHRLQAAALVCRLPGIERAALDPRGRALLPQGEFSLRFGNLFGTCDHRRVPLWEGERLAQRSRCRYRPWHHRPSAVRWLYHVRPHTLPCAVATITAPRAVVSTTSSCLCMTRQWGQGPDAGHDSEMTIGAVDL